MQALEEFGVTVTFRFTPDDLGISPHDTSPLKDSTAFADLCARMVRRDSADLEIVAAQ